MWASRAKVRGPRDGAGGCPCRRAEGWRLGVCTMPGGFLPNSPLATLAQPPGLPQACPPPTPRHPPAPPAPAPQLGWAWLRPLEVLPCLEPSLLWRLLKALIRAALPWPLQFQALCQPTAPVLPLGHHIQPCAVSSFPPVISLPS